jgi:serine protease AprX
MSGPQPRAPRSVAWTRLRSVASAAILGAGGFVATTTVATTPAATLHSYIVQGASTAAATRTVTALGGRVLSQLPSIDGIVARLSSAQAAAVGGEGLGVSPDLTVRVAGAGLPASSHPSGVFTSVTGATSMWAQGITGAGVTVAVLDTGIDSLPDLRGRLIGGVDLADPWNEWNWDGYGHGTFVAGLIASNGVSSGGQYVGEAPGADLVSIKVAGALGITSESTVIEGVAWAVAHRYQYGIRVLNLSLGTEPMSPSALDPLDEEVENAWEAGIVVVTSAGNLGPSNGTITSPGNDPLVITAGALNDGGSTSTSGFSIPSWSSVGPTAIDGWFKPDVVAPGVSVVSLDAPGSLIDSLNPQAKIGNANFVGSGTSFSAAIVSGEVALLLQEYPNLTPDQVKAALLFSAQPGPAGDPFVDGHGIANVAAAAAVAGRVSLNQAPAAAAESSDPPSTISLGSTWAVSSWNPANWSGPAWNASPPATAAPSAAASGLAWSGAEWNGTAWSGAAWTGAEWNGAEWNGAEWNGVAWNGAEWNGAEWNGAEWNAVAFDDETWG